MELFRNELKHATLISVGHRVELEEYHERKLTLHRHAARVEMASDEDIQRGRRLRATAALVATAAFTRPLEACFWIVSFGATS